MSTRILFLDIDGVLLDEHSEKAIELFGAAAKADVSNN